ncbi:hypothetical protein SAMN05192555_10176 [Franzmannia pantelleriensis]|uniref:Uncharacterized protein n=1 Tax=Franzmannia pantelleriensis TaxID=48727 RepID=A0A1G9EDI6_9GAMM|nr:hypothetical protein SAMN05192555_10176 [Halomonas pantelleriensis]
MHGFLANSIADAFGPALWMARFKNTAQLSQDLLRLIGMALGHRDVAQAAVAVLMVVPVADDCTQSRASASGAKRVVGKSGRNFNVLNTDSEWALS